MTKAIISIINKKLHLYRFHLMWHTLKYLYFCAFLIFWFHSPLIMAYFLVKSHLSLLIFLCVTMFCLEAKMATRKDSVINETLESITETRNEWCSLVNDLNRFKCLLKKGIAKKLNILEYFELRDRLDDIGIDIKELKNIEIPTL